jgi:hypothetical protein
MPAPEADGDPEPVKSMLPRLVLSEFGIYDILYTIARFFGGTGGWTVALKILLKTD